MIHSAGYKIQNTLDKAPLSKIGPKIDGNLVPCHVGYTA